MSEALGAAVVQWLTLTAAGAALTALIQSVKYRGFTEEGGLGRDDLGFVALLSIAIVSLASLHPAGAALGAIAATLLYAALWLDAILFRIFTIELGPRGVRSVILSVLYRELAELSFARRFFASHRLFAALPLFALVLHIGVLFVSTRAAWSVLVGVFAVWLCATAVTSAGRRASYQVFGGAFALCVFAVGDALAAAPLPMFAACPVIAALIFVSRRAPGPGSVRDFLSERDRPEPSDFEPRPEHVTLVSRRPQPIRPSALHGSLAGNDVLLLTFESVGRTHLSAFGADGARTPFLERLLSQATRSAHHACVSPTTNNAHAALYTSDYANGASPHLRALREAGYVSAYLTTARTDDYELREILESAAFHHIVDRQSLTNERGLLSDASLLTSGVRELLKVLSGRRPFFLHVHLAETHVPYRVSQSDRFRRFDMSDDRGRFLNGVEQSDWIFEELVSRLREGHLVEDPLIVLSSDHGQAFGHLGYQSHGSAVTREELDVPLLLHHPRLPAREVAFSSHFDVLPTVLDLLGVAHEAPTFGDSLFHDDRSPEMLVWAGHPSRRRTSHYGLLLPSEKILVDLALGRCSRTDWKDERVEELSGADKRYFMALASRMMSLRGVE